VNTKRPNTALTIREIIQRAAAREVEVANSEDGTDSFLKHQLETKSAELERLKIQNADLQEDVEGKKNDRELRKSYASRLYWYLFFYSIFCAAIVISQGIESCPFKLESEVVITLIGSTAVSVIGLVGLVAKGLFDTAKKSN
jgi:hypothetical protein